MKTNLILVEGLPGSGKSTTAAMIAQELKKKGKQIICFDEGDLNHPADYSSYDFPDFETEREMILNKWREFVSESDPATVYVFNCIFLQNPLTEAMIRFGLDEEECLAYINEIFKIIYPLHPLIIYLDQPNVEESIEGVLEERGQNWLNTVVDYHVSQIYGRKNQLSGYRGYLQCLKDRKAREMKILNCLPVPAYVISQDLQAEELIDLFKSAHWSLPKAEQIETAIKNTQVGFVVRTRHQAIATISWLGDGAMHWFMKEFIVAGEYRNQMIGTLLYRFSENYIRSKIQKGWKVCLDLRSSKEAEAFYLSLGFEKMPDHNHGSGMEKMIKKKE